MQGNDEVMVEQVVEKTTSKHKTDHGGRREKNLSMMDFVRLFLFIIFSWLLGVELKPSKNQHPSLSFYSMFSLSLCHALTFFHSRVFYNGPTKLWLYQCLVHDNPDLHGFLNGILIIATDYICLGILLRQQPSSFFSQSA